MTKQMIKISGFLFAFAILSIGVFLLVQLGESIIVTKNKAHGQLIVLGGDETSKENKADQSFDKLSVGTEYSDGAQLVIASDLERGDIMTLYGAKNSTGPMWRWSNTGGAYVRTFLEITGSHEKVNIGGYSSMLKLRSDLSAGHPALIIQTNMYEEYKGPLILGFDWDETMTLAIQSDGSIQSAGVLQTNLRRGLEGEKTMYSAPVGPEVGLYVRGTAKLKNGEAVIELPEHFSEFASEENLTIHLTPLNDWLQLYTTNKTPKSIMVREVSGKTGEFDYIIYGVRKGYENYQPNGG